MGIALCLQQMDSGSQPPPLVYDEAAFNVSGDRDGDVYLVKAEGELDLGTEDVLADELNRAVATDAKHILLDLRGVTFIDSTGICLLVRTHREVPAGRLRLVAAGGQVRRMLELTGVAECFELSQSA